MSRVSLPVLALWLLLGGCLPACAQVVEFLDTPREDEILRVLAPQLAPPGSGPRLTPSIVRDRIDGGEYGAAPPGQAAPAPTEGRGSPAAAAAPQPQDGVIAQSDPFSTGSVSLSPRTTALLDRLANVLRQNPSLRVLITGHTDSRGNPQVNNRLSQARAEKAVRHLEGKGVETAQLVASGRGAKEPVTGLDPTDPRNRRFQIWSLKPVTVQ